MKRALACAVLIVLAACSKDNLNGEVVAKNYEPSHTYTTVSTVCNGKTCTPVVGVTTTPECYSLAVRDEESGEVKGKCINKDRWATVEVGDHYTGEDYHAK